MLGVQYRRFRLPADGGAFFISTFIMRFCIRHLTRYRYAATASESFMEARLTPVSDERQKLLTRRLTTSPACSIHAYTDYFGNAVETFSVVQRHRELTDRK